MNRRRLLAAPALYAALATLAAFSALAPLGRSARAQAPAGAALGVEVAGVRYAPTVQVAGSTLHLNGAGVRYKFVVKVYTAGLYLGSKATTPDAVLAAAGPKRLHVVMLRDIDANELGKLFTRGMQDNAPKETFGKSIPGTLRLADLFAAKKKMATGENFTVDYVPGSGTTVLANGQAQGAPIKEPEFFQALLSIWLGANPADAQLKDLLLGQEPRSASQRSRG